MAASSLWAGWMICSAMALLVIEDTPLREEMSPRGSSGFSCLLCTHFVLPLPFERTRIRYSQADEVPLFENDAGVPCRICGMEPPLLMQTSSNQQ